MERPPEPTVPDERVDTTSEEEEDLPGKDHPSGPQKTTVDQNGPQETTEDHNGPQGGHSIYSGHFSGWFLGHVLGCFSDPLLPC